MLTPSNLASLCDNYGVEGSPWSNTMIAVDATRHPSGHVSRGEAPGTPDTASLARVKRLAVAAEACAKGMEIGMGSEGGEGLEGYYAAATDRLRCNSLDEASFRALFGDALFRDTTVEVEPLSTETEWWRSVREDSEDDERYLAPWRRVLAWFESQPEFVETAFARFDRGETEAFGTDGGCVYPRLFLGRCADGGLAGLLGIVVYT